jgi:tryptophanyl-tRNA synthetase
MRDQFAAGIAWGEAKKQLFELINQQLAGPRQRYNQLVDNPSEVEEILVQGADKARHQSAPLMADLRRAVGIKPLV